MASILTEVAFDALIIELAADAGTLMSVIAEATEDAAAALEAASEEVTDTIMENIADDQFENGFEDGVDELQTQTDKLLTRPDGQELVNQIQDGMENRGYKSILQETGDEEEEVEEEDITNRIDENEPDDEVDQARAVRDAAEEVQEGDTPETKGVKFRQILKALFGFAWWAPALLVIGVAIFIGAIYRALCWVVVKLFEGGETKKKCDTATCATFRALRSWISKHKYWVYAGLGVLSLGLVWARKYEAAAALGLGGAALVHLYLGPLGYVTNEAVCDVSATAHILGF